jgi:hypothetical protein
MGWNTAALYLKGATPAEAVAVLAPATPTDEWVDGDEATLASRDEVLFAGESGGWVQVWNPSTYLALDSHPTGTGLIVFFASTSTIYGYTFYRDGELVRRCVYENWEVSSEEGTPLPAEVATLGTDAAGDEDMIWAVVEEVTGTRFDSDLRYQVYELESP